MKLTSRTEYALLALVFLARQSGESSHSVQAIAAAQDIPPKFLEQILLALKRARIVRSSKGQAGGYALAKSAEDIALAEVVRLFDGPIAPTASVSKYFYEPTPIHKEKRLLRVFHDVRDYVAAKLEKTTLADVS